jgi:NTE family protein
MTKTTRALVLGAGGVVGTAWMAGLTGGLRREGVDLAEADLIVGTSAGAIVGALLATGQDLDRLAGPLRPAGPGGSTSEVTPGLLAEVFAVLSDPRLEPAKARRRVGRLALTAGPGSGQAHLTRMASLITARRWPDRALLITVVNADTGEPEIWDRTSGVPLAAAVASSTAMPGIYPPIAINGGRYIDGGLRSGTNADLAAGAGVLVVVEPLAHLFPREPLSRELAAAGAGAVVTISPDPATLDAFGPDLHDRAAWQPAYRSGVRQAAERLRATWRDGTG